MGFYFALKWGKLKRVNLFLRLALYREHLYGKMKKIFFGCVIT